MSGVCMASSAVGRTGFRWAWEEFLHCVAKEGCEIGVLGMRC